MANDKKQLKVTRARNSAKPASRKKATASSRKKLGRSLSAKAREEVGDQGCAADELLEKANKETADGAAEIARGMRNKARQGSVYAAKFLWELANVAKAKSNPQESRFAAELF